MIAKGDVVEWGGEVTHRLHLYCALHCPEMPFHPVNGAIRILREAGLNCLLFAVLMNGDGWVVYVGSVVPVYVATTGGIRMPLSTRPTISSDHDTCKPVVSPNMSGT